MRENLLKRDQATKERLRTEIEKAMAQVPVRKIPEHEVAVTKNKTLVTKRAVGKYRGWGRGRAG